MQIKRILKWIAAVLFLDKLVELLARIWPTRLRPTGVGERLQRLPFVADFLYWWNHRSPFLRHFMGNLVVGLGIAVLLILFHDTRWLREIEDAGIDWIMAIQGGTAVDEPAVPFVILDIDEQSYQAWGEPFHIPRDRLVTLIGLTHKGLA
jgi:hypothetical protein